MKRQAMSDQLTLSAAISVLMMTVYVLFGSEAARVPFGPAELDVPAHASLPSFDVILVRARAPHILY